MPKMWERNTQVVYELRAEAEETVEHRADNAFSTARWQHEYFGDPSYGWLVASFSTYNSSVCYLLQPDCHSQYCSCGVETPLSDTVYIDRFCLYSARHTYNHPKILANFEDLIFFRRVEKLRKSTISFVSFVNLSVRPSAWKNSAPTGSIFIKFEIWVFSESLLRMFKFVVLWK
jgi:hypothetical protein